MKEEKFARTGTRTNRTRHVHICNYTYLYCFDFFCRKPGYVACIRIGLDGCDMVSVGSIKM